MYELAETDVHVWAVDLREPAPGALALLSEGEIERAARFQFERDRRRFLAARAGLRRVLAGYLGCDAREIRFEAGAMGKPRTPGIEFNLSHSHELALVAVAGTTPVGVDVEYLRPQSDAVAIARRFFPPAEAAAVGADPGAFFRVWTRREAWLKAEGSGLAGLGREKPAEWRVLDLAPAAGYIGAVAFQGERRVRMRS